MISKCLILDFAPRALLCGRAFKARLPGPARIEVGNLSHKAALSWYLHLLISENSGYKLTASVFLFGI